MSTIILLAAASSNGVTLTQVLVLIVPLITILVAWLVKIEKAGFDSEAHAKNMKRIEDEMKTIIQDAKDVDDRVRNTEVSLGKIQSDIAHIHEDTSAIFKILRDRNRRGGNERD